MQERKQRNMDPTLLPYLPFREQSTINLTALIEHYRNSFNLFRLILLKVFWWSILPVITNVSTAGILPFCENRCRKQKRENKDSLLHFTIYHLMSFRAETLGDITLRITRAS